MSASAGFCGPGGGARFARSPAPPRPSRHATARPVVFPTAPTTARPSWRFTSSAGARTSTRSGTSSGPQLADVWIYTIEKNDWQQLRQLRGILWRTRGRLMEDVQQPGTSALLERFGLAGRRRGYVRWTGPIHGKDNVTVVMADEVREAAVDEGKDCRQDGGDQCCVVGRICWSVPRTPRWPATRGRRRPRVRAGRQSGRR